MSVQSELLWNEANLPCSICLLSTARYMQFTFLVLEKVIQLDRGHLNFTLPNIKAHCYNYRGPRATFDCTKERGELPAFPYCK